MAGGMAKPESRNELFDIFIGVFSEVVKGSVDVNDRSSIKKITADEFNKLPPETKRKIYDDIVSKIKIPKLKTPKAK